MGRRGKRLLGEVDTLWVSGESARLCGDRLGRRAVGSHGDRPLHCVHGAEGCVETAAVPLALD